MKAEDAKKIIKSAIASEVEAFNFYNGVATKAKDKASKALFVELAGEEKLHREFLEGFLKKSASEMKFDAGHDYKVGDGLESPKLTEDLKPVEGLVIAIKKELEAMLMYTQLGKAATDTETKLLFTQLANMERSHKARLEDIYVNMSMVEVW
jgi:rubrerythrin